ncbi:MAG: tetratricopeptide repeat protein [Planctomycetales bacterium]
MGPFRMDGQPTIPREGGAMHGPRSSSTWSAHGGGSSPAASLLLTLGWVLALIAASLLLAPQAAGAADLAECLALHRQGQHEKCIAEAARAIEAREYGEGWRIAKAQSELALGRYADAANTVEQGLARYESSVRLRLVGVETMRHAARAETAGTYLEEIADLAATAPWRYTDAADLVAIGEAALLAGGDAREVLEGFFDRAMRKDGGCREAFLASGRLALAKHDPGLAAEILGDAAARFPDDPEVQHALASALEEVDPQRATELYAKVRKLDPRHVPTLVALAGRRIDSEDYAGAEKLLAEALAVNPRNSEAWALRAAIAHLANRPDEEERCRDQALASWQRNPLVDHVIGQKLSQKYRFAEGAARQKQALAFDERYLPARIQLAQDLLRLGREAEGWRLAEATHETDGYDVVTFNLLELRDRIAKFATVRDDDFVVRMEAREAEVYGDRVLALLGRAKRTLCARYELDLREPIVVEIFTDPNDFAVRTFGMPAASGYLGVCFGKVITANSPDGRGGRPFNWESVLWHEFCHVVTLERTHNRMPRWLSEGISVYEERRADPAWGQSMTPAYREMILGGALTPIGSLSSAFLSPKSPLHVAFAYYESALVVEYLVDEYGLESLQNVLEDLAAGIAINDALERRCDPLLKLELEFHRFARERAEAFAPRVDWSAPDLAALSNDDADALGKFVKEHPTNRAALSAQADALLAEQAFEQAKAPLRKLIDLFPEDAGPEAPHVRLAQCHRALGEFEEERVLLEAVAWRDPAAIGIYIRLAELARKRADWQAVVEHVERALAVNPMLPAPWRDLAIAHDRLGADADAARAYRTLLAFDPPDPARLHFRLAELQHRAGDRNAKRHVLLAIEHAPRFRDAHRLLLQMNRGGPPEPPLLRVADGPPDERTRE